MTAKPSTAPFHWATGSPAYRSPNPIPTPRQDEGLQNGDPADPLAFNSLLGNVTDWTVYLGQFSVSTGVEYRTAYQVWDSVGGASLGHLTSVTGDILLAANDGVILQAGGTGTPTIYLDNVNDTVRLQSFGADGAVLLRAGWALNDQSFRVGFGDTVGDGTGYPTYTWDLSPAFGGWSAYATSGTGLAVVGFDPASSTATADYARIWNYSGATSRLFARSALRQSVLISEDGTVARETAFQLQIRFESDAAGAQPTVSLVAKTSGSTTIIATCTCGSSTSAQTITSSPFTHDFDWSANRYFLEWDSVSTVADGQGSRIVSRVSLSNLTRAG